MPDLDIVNCNAQFLLGIGEAVWITTIFKGIPCFIIGVYASNAFVLSRAFSPSYQRLEGNTRGVFGGFISDIMIEDGLFVDDNSRQHDRSTLNQSGINTSVDPTVTYPFVHTCMSFNSVQDISRHQKCVMCMAEGRKKATYIYCGFCTNTSHREIDRHSSRHAYCMGCKYQCFQRQTPL